MIVQCKPLMDILNLVKVMGADGATIVPAANGWEFYVRDVTNCMMVSALLSKDAFDEYDPEMAPFAVEIDFLRDSLAKRDEVQMDVEDAYIRINSGKSKAKRRLYTIDETPRIVPRVHIANSVAVLSDNLLDAGGHKFLQNADSCATGLQVDISEQEITFSFESETEAYSETYDCIMSDIVDGPQTCHYQPTYILPVFKALPKGIPVILTMDTDKPLKMTVQTQMCKIDVFIAPRIEE